MFGGICSSGFFRLPLPLCQCLVDPFVTLCQWHRAQRVHQRHTLGLDDTVWQRLALVIFGVEHRRYPVTHKPECGGSGTLCRHQREGIVILMSHIRTERQHIKLTVYHRPDDTTRLCLYDGKTVYELGVIELRSKLQSGSTVTLPYLLITIVVPIDAVEGRQHVSVVKGNIIDAGCVVFDDDRHCLTVLTDRTCHNLFVHIEIVLILEGHIVIRLTDIFPWVFGQYIHRGDEPEDNVTLLHIKAEFCIHVVLDIMDFIAV